jgi:hypothetical protein
MSDLDLVVRLWNHLGVRGGTPRAIDFPYVRVACSDGMADAQSIVRLR